ncbi:hypothetical protein [Streptomyces longwoodensis]|uniref:hypothetical protein n=1 Tax=Streptomyces longwoodensis TaxID=68231 RepID=UPI002258526A|nr:hypothetical protein [Streptomyces longwoodensis]MCX5000995.1 hypothetical protein [Streptomyces longwoodensis]
MDAATLAWLHAELGTTTDQADLTTRYTRLGTARAVAIEVIRERLAALRAQPAKVTVNGVVGVDYTETIKAYERQLTILESGQPPAPDDPAGTGTDANTIGIVYLRERARR